MPFHVVFRKLYNLPLPVDSRARTQASVAGRYGTCAFGKELLLPRLRKRSSQEVVGRYTLLSDADLRHSSITRRFFDEVRNLGHKRTASYSADIKNRFASVTS